MHQLQSIKHPLKYRLMTLFNCAEGEARKARQFNPYEKPRIEDDANRVLRPLMLKDTFGPTLETLKKKQEAANQLDSQTVELPAKLKLDLTLHLGQPVK